MSFDVKQRDAGRERCDEAASIAVVRELVRHGVRTALKAMERLAKESNGELDTTCLTAA